MNPFQFSMLQQPFNIHNQLNTISDYNPYGMGIPNNSQTSPYVQYSPYQQGQSPYTQWFGNQIASQNYDPNYYSNLMELMNQSPQQNYDPNYYSNLTELMNQSPQEQYLDPFQAQAEEVRTAQATPEPVPEPAPAPAPAGPIGPGILASGGQVIFPGTSGYGYWKNRRERATRDAGRS